MSQAQPGLPSPDSLKKIHQLLTAAFASQPPALGTVTDINRGRGVFSDVYQIDLRWPSESNGPRPDSLVAKLPCQGPNRTAASTSGAYRRELVTYSQLLVDSTVRRPMFYAGLDFGDDTTGLLIEDLTSHRSVDQLVGLRPTDAIAVAEALAQFHHEWSPLKAAGTTVRRSIVGKLPESNLKVGIETLNTVWSDHVEPPVRAAFQRLLNARSELVELFLDEAQPVTLCHGDPRADNLVFDSQGNVILFDWQQIAVQIGEADLAWLAGTSVDTETRRSVDREIVSAYGGDFQRYRLGFALPGFAVLMLAQRQLQTRREVEFVAESIRRIGQALLDLEVSELRR